LAVLRICDADLDITGIFSDDNQKAVKETSSRAAAVPEKAVFTFRAERVGWKPPAGCRVKTTPELQAERTVAPRALPVSCAGLTLRNRGK